MESPRTAMNAITGKFGPRQGFLPQAAISTGAGIDKLIRSLEKK